MSTATIARALPVRGVRQILGQASAAVVVAAAASGLTYYFTIGGSLLGLAAMVVVVGTVWFAATRHTGLALALLMLYLGALDGYLKLASGSGVVTFVRDFLLYAIVIGLLVRASATRRPLPSPPLSGWVLAFSVLVLIQLFNPQNGSLVHSLAGVRQSLEFVPLFFLTFAFVRTKRALRTFAILFVSLAAANGVVNVVQSQMSPQQLAAWGPGYADRVLGKDQFALGGRTFHDTQGEHTRPFGLMSDAGTGGLVCALSLGCVLSLASLRNRRRYLAVAGVAAPVLVAGIITSQGRAVVIGSFVVVLAYAAVVATSRGRSAMLASVAALAVVAYFAGTDVLGGTPTRYSGLNASSLLTTTSQARGKAFEAIPTNLTRYPLGSGLGTGGPAAVQRGAPAAAETANAENEISFATLEAGIPGMLVLVGFTAAVFMLGLRRIRHEPDPEARLLLAAIIAPVAALFAIYWVSPISPTSPGGPYLWAAAGIVSYWLVARPAARAASARSRPRIATRDSAHHADPRPGIGLRFDL